jgi:hypothetical protein
VRDAVGQQVRDALLADAVLRHLDGADAGVGGVGLGPGGHAAVLQAVAAADDGLEVRDRGAVCAGLGLLARERGEGVGDEDAGGGAQAVVVQEQVAQGCVLGEEVDEGRDRVEAEGVVREVDRVQVGQREQRGEEEGQRGRDLGEEARREDVGEVGGLGPRASVIVGGGWQIAMKERLRRTLRLFLVSRTLARASLASTPSVLPRNLTSSTCSLSIRALMCGSMSSAVVSLRPLPSREKILEEDMMCG